MHLVEDDRADLAADVVDRAAREARVVHTDLVGGAGVRIEDEHGGGGVDAAVDHVLELAVLDRAGRLGAGVVPYVAVAQTGAPHTVEDVRMTRLGEHENRVVGFHGRDQVFVLAGNIENFHLFKVDLRVFRVVLQPCEDLRVAEHSVCHNAHSFYLSCTSRNDSFSTFYHYSTEKPQL